MAAFSKGHKKAGGQKAGVPNKSTVQARELAKIAERKGLTPLDGPGSLSAGKSFIADA